MASIHAKSEGPQASSFTPAKYTTEGVVTVVVGPDQKEFILHRSLLVSHSPYFRGCLESGFQESQTGRVNLLEDESSVFAVIVNWMYGGLTKNSSPMPEDVERSLIKAYYLADMLIMTRCKNDIMDNIRRCYVGNSVASKTMTFLQLDVNTHLNDFYIQKYAHSMICHPSNITYLDAQASFKTMSLFGEGSIAAAIMHQIAVKLARMEGSEPRPELFISDPAELEECLYHDHGTHGILCASVADYDVATTLVW